MKSTSSPHPPTATILNVGLAVFGITNAALAAAACATLAGGPHFLPLALADEAAAERAANPEEARRWTQSALAIRPVDVAGWVRLAGLESGSPQTRLSSTAEQALDRSYAVGPYSSSVLESRVRFAYGHWASLSPDLREQVVSEVKAAWSVAPQQQRLLVTAGRIQDSAGALTPSGLLLTQRLQDDADSAARRAAMEATKPIAN